MILDVLRMVAMLPQSVSPIAMKTSTTVAMETV